jgi:hypothetical protein
MYVDGGQVPDGDKLIDELCNSYIDRYLQHDIDVIRDELVDEFDDADSISDCKRVFDDDDNSNRVAVVDEFSDGVVDVGCIQFFFTVSNAPNCIRDGHRPQDRLGQRDCVVLSEQVSVVCPQRNHVFFAEPDRRRQQLALVAALCDNDRVLHVVEHGVEEWDGECDGHGVLVVDADVDRDDFGVALVHGVCDGDEFADFLRDGNGVRDAKCVPAGGVRKRVDVLVRAVWQRKGAGEVELRRPVQRVPCRDGAI